MSIWETENGNTRSRNIFNLCPAEKRENPSLELELGEDFNLMVGFLHKELDKPNPPLATFKKSELLHKILLLYLFCVF